MTCNFLATVQFYADEDHSIRSTRTVQQHVYRNIITRIVESWGYKWNGNGNSKTSSPRAYTEPTYDVNERSFDKLQEAERFSSPEL